MLPHLVEGFDGIAHSLVVTERRKNRVLCPESGGNSEASAKL